MVHVQRLLVSLNVKKGLHRAKHDTTTVRQQGKVEQVWTQYFTGLNNVLNNTVEFVYNKVQGTLDLISL